MLSFNLINYNLLIFVIVERLEFFFFGYNYFIVVFFLLGFREGFFLYYEGDFGFLDVNNLILVIENFDIKDVKISKEFKVGCLVGLFWV